MTTISEDVTGNVIKINNGMLRTKFLKECNLKTTNKSKHITAKKKDGIKRNMS